MKTYAQKAKEIQKRYPHADRVDADREAMMSELHSLFEDQERKKQEMQVEQQGNQFTSGGSTGPYPPKFNQSFYNMLGSPAQGPAINPYLQGAPQGEFLADAMDRFGIVPTYEDLTAFNKWKSDEFKNNPLLKTYEPTGDTLQFGEDTLSDIPSVTEAGEGEEESGYDFNKSDLLNMASGATAALGNLANMRNVKNPKRITPPVVNPTFKFRGTNIAPYETAIKNSRESDKYALLTAGADFDTVVGGVNKLNDTYASNLGRMQVEKANLDNKEGARGDAIVNQALYYNATNLNDANIDQATRQDIAEQRRRDYFNALTGNVSTMFDNAANRAYANELGPDMANSAMLQAILNNMKQNG